ncbi:hypothetical protein SDC9_153413 [bioreactor metagenome]|uniref:Uncharacterized protein n=1 Tax=bioreactor metagenome TaxID=1076179 RepID=A0A645EWA5_9ZZZZ
MSSIEGYIDYTKREFCHAIPCPVQVLLDKQANDPEQFEFTRSICKTSCIHSTHEFHAWLIEKGYLVVRPIK